MPATGSAIPSASGATIPASSLKKARKEGAHQAPMLRLAIAGLLAFPAVGCGGPSPLVFNPKYQDAKFEGRVLHVLPLADLHVDNPSDFQDDFERVGATKNSLPGPFIARLF